MKKKLIEWWNKNYRYSNRAQRVYLTPEDYEGVANLIGGWKRTLDKRRSIAHAKGSVKFIQAFFLGVAISLTSKIIDCLFTI